MADDRRKTWRLDRDRIGLNGEYEAKDWAQKFGVTKDELVAGHGKHLGGVRATPSVEDFGRPLQAERSVRSGS